MIEKFAIYSDGKFYKLKGADTIDHLIKEFITRGNSLDDLIESQEAYLRVNDALEYLVNSGLVEKRINGTGKEGSDEDKLTEEVRNLVKVLKERKASNKKEL
jgi:hypothetical protein